MLEIYDRRVYVFLGTNKIVGITGTIQRPVMHTLDQLSVLRAHESWSKFLVLPFSTFSVDFRGCLVIFHLKTEKSLYNSVLGYSLKLVHNPMLANSRGRKWLLV